MERKPPFRALLLWEFYLFALFLILLLLIFAVLVPHTWLWNLVTGCVTVCYLAASVGYLPLLFARLRYRTDEREIVVESGVFFRKRKVLYRDALVTVSRFQTPLTVLLSLDILRCGGPGGSVTLAFLSRKDGEAFCEAFASDRPFRKGGPR